MSLGRLPRVLRMPLARSAWQRLLFVGSMLLVVAVVEITPALAEPAFAVRTGYRCSQCHVNRSGGGLRTPFGSIYMQTILPEKTWNLRTGSNLLPANPDARFAVGGDFRGQLVNVNAKQAANVTSFELTEANIYAEARLLPGKLSLYLDETLGPGGATTREVFGLATFRRWNAYVKAGRFLPPFGYRLPDDSAFIRQFTGFTYSAPDTGIEFGIEPGRWSVHLAATNGAAGGSDDNESKKLSLLTTRHFRRGRLGVSAANNIGSGATTTHGGVLGGANWGRLAVLAEADWVRTSQGGVDADRALGLIELDLLVSRGLNVKYARDWIDPDRDISTDDRVRDSFGVEYFPYPFVQLRLFARREDGPPQLPGTQDEQFELELHLYF